MPSATPKRSKEKPRKRRSGPPSTDRHWLYQEAVQSPDVHIDFINRVYKKHNGRLPLSLKEDFCGTALMSAEWVRQSPKHSAVGVDLHRPTLRWGTKHNVAPLGAAASRVHLIEEDVRRVTRPMVDVVAAFNFSYFIFKTPEALRGYFAPARRSLKPGGLLVLDIFGGWEAQQEVTDKTRLKGFTYVWEQKGINPVNHEGRFNIHFKFHGGGGIKRAFSYDWRLWSVPEVREELEAVGFEAVDVYLEGYDSDGDGNGVFRLAKHIENCPGWNAFIVAR